ncbi:hypothetical protein BZK31_24455 [Pseudomonas floridensis]|uniref:RHS repeat-associated core domain-containing protein n=1 Tax=Pseudomonas floridensis TaxID=1958950 RepID=A0A1X0N188_9PSED|nr:RHS repeat-associated core domain-containing protein [Pseudomonas floridensis]ORC55732.1 hypothetical protein BZK31_24455 [Pseudomonas floridensis]
MKFKKGGSDEVLCSYRYDPLDRIGSRKESGEFCQRFYQENRLASEVRSALTCTVFRNANILLAERAYDPASSQGANVVLLTDRQHSVVGTVDLRLFAALSYTAYGYQASSTGDGSLMRFAGERPDNVTGHYLLGNGYRAYNPTLMRFNSPDSRSPFDQGGLNAYAYCGADPVNRVDPNGDIYSGIVLKAASRFLGLIGHKPRLDTLAPRLTRTPSTIVKSGRTPKRLIAHVDESPPLEALPQKVLAKTPRERHVLETSEKMLLTHHRRYVKSSKEMLSEKRSVLRQEAALRDATQNLSKRSRPERTRPLSKFDVLQAKIAQQRSAAGRAEAHSLLGWPYGIRSNSLI